MPGFPHPTDRRDGDPGRGHAAAAAETTAVVSDAGSVTNSVTGDTGTYVLGRTVEGAATRSRNGCWNDRRRVSTRYS